ncbi:MAG: class I SAM-dependent methyltransferase [Bacillota bacterium]|nr:class I SAM-dependent methyltransferase [Bacillota bacterium]
MVLEKMSDFFADRADTYDEHMLKNVEGCKNGYLEMAKLLPSATSKLLDLGCGTGLELGKIFELYPSISVTGIDLSETMTRKLKEKYSGRDITIINGSYLGYDFGFDLYDAAISFQTMHHLSHSEKISVYSEVCKSLKSGGTYIECDYMVTDKAEEDFLYAENSRVRKEQNIPDGEFYHFDTPCTIENQVSMLLQAGFASAEFVWREGNTTIIISKK